MDRDKKERLIPATQTLTVGILQLVNELLGANCTIYNGKLHWIEDVYGE